MDKKTFNGSNFVKAAIEKPGVYCMLDADKKIIYVGKSRNLKHRLASYFNQKLSCHSPKTRALIQQIQDIQLAITHTETEALILESNLIKKHHPRYNIWFKDDKSYPYIYIDKKQDFPKISYYRGVRKKYHCFGPYPNSGAVRKTIKLVQKLFLLRTCDEHFFHHRTRPCLEYQIKRCSAPCTGEITKSDYQLAIRNTVLFLEGKNNQLIKTLTKPMQQAADNLDYEGAAKYRDQIRSLRKIQEQQHASKASSENTDVIAIAKQDDTIAINLLIIRNGEHLGHKHFFPRHPTQTKLSDAAHAFLSQYYLTEDNQNNIPTEILITEPLTDKNIFIKLLSQRANRIIKIKHQPKKHRRKWLQMALDNVLISLQQYLANKQHMEDKLTHLQHLINLPKKIERIECFDISHTQGESPVAACVVFDKKGAVSADYRLFNIKGITPGDDYAAMAQATYRHYSQQKKTNKKTPDLLLIDGGKGQVRKVQQTLQTLSIKQIYILGVAKGVSRKAGEETLVLTKPSNRLLKLASNSPILHLIQKIRDEAHRFAITGHRKGRQKRMTRSILEDIEGIGHKRRRQLLNYFGGLQGITQAGVDDLKQVAGINAILARKIYNNFH